MARTGDEHADRSDTSPTADHDEDDADGCLWRRGAPDEDATSTRSCPHASGGVEANGSGAAGRR